MNDEFVKICWGSCKNPDLPGRWTRPRLWSQSSWRTCASCKKNTPRWLFRGHLVPEHRNFFATCKNTPLLFLPLCYSKSRPWLSCQLWQRPRTSNGVEGVNAVDIKAPDSLDTGEATGASAVVSKDGVTSGAIALFRAFSSVKFQQSALTKVTIDDGTFVH